MECRYYGRDFTVEEIGAAARADRRPPAAQPPYAVEGVLPAHRLGQARRRAEGHDGQGHHAGHAQGQPDHTAGADPAAEPAKADRLRAGHRAAAVPDPDHPRRGPPAPDAHRRARHPRGASSGTSSSPATTTSATPPWSAPRCATPSMTETAGRSPCSASQPPPGSWRRAMPSSAGPPICARRNLPLVVDNPRFLILPWIEIPNLGSHILAIVRRRLPGGWAERYNTAPVLIETFVQTQRYTGAVYKAFGLDPRRDHPRDAGATTGTSCTTSPGRTSGSGPCGKTGSEPSIAESSRLHGTTEPIPFRHLSCRSHRGDPPADADRLPQERNPDPPLERTSISKRPRFTSATPRPDPARSSCRRRRWGFWKRCRDGRTAPGCFRATTPGRPRHSRSHWTLHFTNLSAILLSKRL